MDGLRNYPDDPEGRWYPDERGYPDRRGYEDDRYRVPDPRHGDEAPGRFDGFAEPPGDPGRYGDGPTDARAPRSASVGPRSGVELPPLGNPLANPLPSPPLDPPESRFGEPAGYRAEPGRFGPDPDPRFHTEPIDRAELRRPPSATPPAVPGAPSVSGPPSASPPPGLAPTTSLPPVPGAVPPGGAPSPTVYGPGGAPLGGPGGGPLGGPGGGPLGGPGGGPLGGPGAPGPGFLAGGPGGEPGAGVYRTKRAGAAIVLVVVAVVAELLLVRVLFTGEFGHQFVPGAVLAGLFAMCGIPLTSMGLYGLVSGAAAAGPAPTRAWLRPPLAYLPVGLVLLIAAGLAAG